MYKKWVMNTPKQNLRIVHLVDSPDAALTLAKWFVEEWEPWYGADGQGDAERDLADCCSKNDLPICLIAFDRNGDVLGTAALKLESVGSELGVGPWLAAVLVGQSHQGKGVGTALVKAIEEEAARLGFESIFTSTDSAVGILERRGWQAFGTTESLRGPVPIYRWQVRGETASSA